MELSSKLIENAVHQFASLPGIGKRTALRLVLSLLKREPGEVRKFSHALVSMKEGVKHCVRCHNISDAEQCVICSDYKRDRGVLCVVEDIRDVIAIENTNQFRGVYHVLGGVISPMDGIGPQDLTIESLVEKAKGGEVSEVILALSTTMEGDTTNFYLYKKLRDYVGTISLIARGISVGGELEYTDELTLGRSLLNRTPYENTLAGDAIR